MRALVPLFLPIALLFVAPLRTHAQSSAPNVESSATPYALPAQARRSMLKWGFGVAATGYVVAGGGFTVLALAEEPISANLLIATGTVTMTVLTARLMRMAGRAHGGQGNGLATYSGMAAGLTLGVGLWLGAWTLASFGSDAVELGVLAGASILAPLGVVAGSYFGFWRSHRNRVLTRLKYGAQIAPQRHGVMLSLSWMF